MENIENMTQDDVLDVITDFPVKPLGRKLLITLNMEESDSDLILTDSEFAETQFVVAKGDHITSFEAGAKVILDLEKMMEYRPNPENSNERLGAIKIKPIEVGGKVYGLINDNVVEAIDLR